MNCWWEYNNGEAAVENHLILSQKVMYITNTWPRNRAPKEVEAGPGQVLLTRVHSSFIHNSQEVETIQVSIHKRMDQRNTGYTHNGIVFSHEKEWNFDIFYIMDRFQKNYAKWNKPVIEGWRLSNSIYMRTLKYTDS